MIIRIKNHAYILLSYRQRSRAELVRRLKEKGYAMQNIESVLDDFESKGYINDSNFAKMYANHLVTNKNIGEIAVRNKFFPHQIPDHILNPILDNLYGLNPPEKLVKLTIEKRMRSREASKKEKTKLMNILKRRGFSWDEIEPKLNKLNWVD